MHELSAGRMLPALLLFPLVAAGDLPDRTQLTPGCEVAVALSALPSRLRQDATVYVYSEGDYVIGRRGEGPFTCIIERSHPASLAPQCMDRAGVDSVLPAVVLKSQLALTGRTDVEEAIEERIAGGRLEPAARPGVSYMMSDYNYIYVPQAEAVMKVPPHVMYYAPGLRNEDVGGSLESATANIGTPFVFNEGPFGFLITYVELSADSDAVVAACSGQLGEVPRRFEPFPRAQ